MTSPISPPRDAGTATLWVVIAMAVVVAAGVAVTMVGAAVNVRHRAALAADAAALAAALHTLDGSDTACRAAAKLAARNGARLSGCVVSGSTVEISVEITLPTPLSRLGTAVGRARAGPATAR